MNGEQLCYMHRFVHRSLFIEIQNGDIPKCPYLVTIYRLTLLVATTRQFSLIILRFRLWKKDRTLILHRRSYLLV